MGVADIPLLGQIKGRLGWLDERQRVIAENVANAHGDLPWRRCARWAENAASMVNRPLSKPIVNRGG